MSCDHETTYHKDDQGPWYQKKGPITALREPRNSCFSSSKNDSKSWFRSKILWDSGSITTNGEPCAICNLQRWSSKLISVSSESRSLEEIPSWCGLWNICSWCVKTKCLPAVVQRRGPFFLNRPVDAVISSQRAGFVEKWCTQIHVQLHGQLYTTWGL